MFSRFLRFASLNLVSILYRNPCPIIRTFQFLLRSIMGKRKVCISCLNKNYYLFGQEMINVTNRHGEKVRVMEYRFIGRLYEETFYTAEEILENIAA